MTRKSKKNSIEKAKLLKCPTGIQGLDEITNGGLPQGRTTLLCGGAGCGKTVLAMEFLVRGVLVYGEPGIFMSFEETEEDLCQNFLSLGYSLDDLIRNKLLILEHVYVERNEIEETGEYDLEALFIRLGYAIDTIGAKRVVLDTIETLFSGLQNEFILRSELRRLFRWLKARGVTAIVTGEKGEKLLTRYGIEEYVSDCVIMLDNRVEQLITTRYLRIVKYRGSVHSTNEYPFLLDEQGISVQPVTSIGLNHTATYERISSGISKLDDMLEGKGYYRGSSILISGTAGSGKSSMAAHFVRAACQQEDRCIYFALEESAAQIIRNQHSIGIELEPFVEQGILKIHAARPSVFGLEMHLATMQKLVSQVKPRVVVIDPITNLISVGSVFEVRSMLTRLIDWLKVMQVTSLYTSLSTAGTNLEQTEVGISSLMDTWLLLRDIELNGERNRGLHILKSRGMAHSNQISEFLLTNHGVELMDVYLGSEGVLTGTSRIIQEEKDREALLGQQQELLRRQIHLKEKREALSAQIKALEDEFAGEEKALQLNIKQQEELGKMKIELRQRIANSRIYNTGQNAD